MKLKKIILVVLAVFLVAEIGILAVLGGGEDEDVLLQDPGISATTPSETTEVLTTEDTTVLDDGTTPAETETVPETQPATEPDDNRYTLSFAGDCTFGSLNKNWSHEKHFIQTVGENYDYPFAQVRQYLENDDFTIINLEGPLTDSDKGAQSKTFSFRGPTAYTQIMTGSSVEAVTLANNHSMDYGQAGYDSTVKALGEAGIAYVEKNKTKLYTTESGLKIGMYAGAFDMTVDGIKKGIASLRNSGAEIIICAFHWGNEGEYRPTADQQKIAKAAIDAGADVVYGHHPHVLQKIEQYKDGYIFYSLGNFAFGGIAAPRDTDTALLQLEVVRNKDGSVSLGELDIIPCTYRAEGGYNSYQPTPMKVDGTAYNRVLSKLDGTFTGPDLTVDYDEPAKPTKPPATEAPGGNGGGNEGGNEGGGSENPGGDSGGNTGGGESGGGSSGGDSGGSEGGGGGGEKPADPPAPSPDPPAQPAPPPDPPAQPAPPANPAPPEGGEG